MSIAIYPGSFDPITYGHIDIVERATQIFQTVIVVFADNSQKKPFFTIEDRMAMARECFAGNSQIKVIRYSGLIVNCLAEYGATVIIRGLRAISDFEYEFQMAFTNKSMNKQAETVFLMASARYTYLNSTMVKQIASLGGDVSKFVPGNVQQQLAARIVTVP